MGCPHILWIGGCKKAFGYDGAGLSGSAKTCDLHCWFDVKGAMGNLEPSSTILVNILLTQCCCS